MAFSEELIQQVWEKARAVSERDSDEWRQDECGAWLKRKAYNKEQSDFGWQVVNTSPGGPDVLENLIPLHCNNSFDHANGSGQCHITADRSGIQPTAHVDAPLNKGV